MTQPNNIKLGLVVAAIEWLHEELETTEGADPTPLQYLLEAVEGVDVQDFELEELQAVWRAARAVNCRIDETNAALCSLEP